MKRKVVTENAVRVFNEDGTITCAVRTDEGRVLRFTMYPDRLCGPEIDRGLIREALDERSTLTAGSSARSETTDSIIDWLTCVHIAEAG